MVQCMTIAKTNTTNTLYLWGSIFNVEKGWSVKKKNIYTMMSEKEG